MNSNGVIDEKWRAGLEAWRAGQRHDMTLPSGLEVELRHVALQDLLIQGDIPDSLSGLVSDAISGKEFKINASDMKLLTDMFNVVVRACLINPPVADVPDDAHIGINELSFEDKQTIFDWANGDAKALRPFRGKQSGNVDQVASVGEAVRHTAVIHSSDNEPMDGVPV